MQKEDIKQKRGLKKVVLNAFTLAEVLIVIGIIGIVAEMIIPDLMNKFQNQTYVVGMKKAYAATNQALAMLANDYGCTGDLKCTNLFTASSTAQDFGDQIVKYFKVIKNCQMNTTVGCFSTAVSGYYDHSNGEDDYTAYGNYYRFVTVDGMNYMYFDTKTNCAGFGGAVTHMSQVCGVLYIDVNGDTKPNSLGRDIQYFFITNGKGPSLYVQGGIDDPANYWKTVGKCTSTNTEGGDCAARIIDEGWQMNY